MVFEVPVTWINISYLHLKVMALRKLFDIS